MSGSGICPVCNRSINEHSSAERKVCHDTLSGWERDSALKGHWQPGYCCDETPCKYLS